jgi:tape measure domain-containing protein
VANFNVSYFVKIRDQFSAPARKIAASASTIKQKTESLAKSLPRTAAQFKTLSKSVKESGKAMKDFGAGMAMKVTAPLALLGGVALKQHANLETLGVGFETMLGSADKSKEMMKELVAFTATTPFQLKGVGDSAKQLLAFGVVQKDMIPTLSKLGDISSGAGVPLKDMALIFGKAKAKGKMMTEEILQMAERGVPIVEVLSKQFGVTKNEIFDMASKSKISFGAMQTAIGTMTDKGGIFYQSTIKQSETLAGRYSTLQDNVLLTAASLGEVLSESIGLNKILENMSLALTPLSEKIKAFAQEHPAVTKMIIAFIAFMAVLAPLIIIVGQLAIAVSAIIAIAPLIGAAFVAIGGAVMFLTTGFLGLAFAVLAATYPFILIVAGIWLVYKAAGLLGDLFAYAFPDAASAMTDAIQNTFGTFFGFIDDAGKRFDAFISDIKNSGVAKIAAFFGIGGDGEKPESALPESSAIPNQNSQTDVNVNLKAPENVIESVKTKTKGNGANVGTNMVNA